MARTTLARIAADKIEEYRLALERKEEELHERLSAVRAAEVVQRPEEPLDSGDWCQKSQEEWVFLNRNRLEMALLRDIQGARGRLRDGSYGLCQECECHISCKRLDAVPWARYCASCQETHAELSGCG